MKKILGLLFISIFGASAFLLAGCTLQIGERDDEYLRIHIRANSNAEVDQEIKYEIKEYVLDFLTPIIAECESKEEIDYAISRNLAQINNVCNEVLEKNGFNYVANSKLCNEFFPTRTYGELTLEQGYYDALIVELGEAEGNNWWCVVYPPLCFVNAKEINGKNFRYKSKIMELINR